MDPVLNAEDIYYELSTIRDPEHLTLTLADLDVVALDRCWVTYGRYIGHPEPTIVLNPMGIPVKRYPKRVATVEVELLPTVPHCHLMMIIGLSVRAKLMYDLPQNSTIWRIILRIKEGSHLQHDDIEKQLNDKERVCGALENPVVLKEVQKLITYECD
eukprot:Tbor_TRINITY_DN5518_c0_g1::TRINITY_DN5518_c0_g1_i1::g.13144::m.13144